MKKFWPIESDKTLKQKSVSFGHAYASFIDEKNRDSVFLGVLFLAWLFSVTTYNTFLASISFIHVWILSAVVCLYLITKKIKSIKSVSLMNPGLFFTIFGIWIFALGYVDVNVMIGSKMAMKFCSLGILCVVLSSSTIEYALVKRAFAAIAILNTLPFLLSLVFPELLTVTLPSAGARLLNHYNFVGNIWKIGLILVLLFLTDSIFTKKKESIFLFFIGMAILGLDESRTGLLLLIVSLSILFVLSTWHQAAKSFLKLVAAGTIVMFLVPTLWLDRMPFIGRYFVAIQEIEQNQKERSSTPQTNEEIRYETVKRFDSYIQNADLVGHGFNDSDVIVDKVQRVALHCAYLQILNDFGIIGLIIWLLMVCFQFIYKPIQVFNFVKGQANLWPFYIFCLVWPINFVFQPLSTELYEWGFFILSSAIVIRTFENSKMYFESFNSSSEVTESEQKVSVAVAEH